MTRFKGVKVLLGCAVGFPVSAAALWVGFHLVFLRSCVPDWQVPGARTVCSADFSERNFAKIRVGMTSDEVVDILGPPLKITESSSGRIKRMIDYGDNGQQTISFPDLKPDDPASLTGRTYYYTQQAHPTADWLVRVVDLDRNGVVKEVYRSVYFD